MAFKEYGNYDAVGLAELVRKKEVTARELLDEAIARTAKVDPQINAVVVKHYDYAERQIERGLPDGPFTGVPFLLKDLDPLEGTRTTFGATVLKDFVADHNGTLVQRFLDTGVSIFGKSSSPEFGLMPTTKLRLHGPTRNPWNLEHSSGGSSGGAAAAVAARILPVAHASDGGGSIRIPASASGVFGLKPTRARNPLGPDRGEGWGGFACGHVVSISVRDSAVMMDAIHGPEPSSPYVAPPPERPFSQEVGRDPGRLRIAFTDKSPYGDAIDPEIAAAVREIAGLLAGLGHHVEERAPVACRRPGRGHDHHRRRQHRADGAADRATARAHRHGKRFRDTDAGVRSQRAKDQRDRLCRRPARGLPDFALARHLLRELRRLPVSDIVLAAAANRRTQQHVERPVAHCPDPAPLYAGHLHVQHVRPAGDVGATGVEQGRLAARHDVLGQVRR